MENPFETGHIKNYVLAYSSVVVIMILFFVASTLFLDIEQQEQKVFDTNISSIESAKIMMKNIVEVNSSKFKLMDKAY